MNGNIHVQSLSKTKHILNDINQCDSFLQHCISTKSLSKTKKLHALIITSGLFFSTPSPTHLFQDLAKAYGLSGHITHARKLFDRLPQRSLFLSNAVIRMHMLCGQHHDALQVFSRMFESGNHRPDNFTYTFAAKACGGLLFLEMGFAVHGRIMVDGFGSDSFVQNSLVAMYMNCREVEAARKVFEEMTVWTVVSWNTLINGYFRNGCAEEAIRVFQLMMDMGYEVDPATAVSVLPACGYVKNVELGRYVHGLVAEKCLGKTMVVSNALIDMYARCGRMSEAQSVIEKMVERDVVTWTSLINGYILSCNVRNALESFRGMISDGVRPNSVTISSLLSACGRSYFRYGRCLHGWSVRHMLQSDVLVETALIDMYANCKGVDLSFRVFMCASKKRTVPWNAIISACVRNDLAEEAIETYKWMLMERVEQNVATLKSLIPAYAIQADLQQALSIHGYLTRSGWFHNVEITTGLIDAYAKCGNLEYAHKVFNGIPSKDKDVLVWSVIVSGYGMHGRGETAVLLFNQMVQSGVKPNEVTFTSVLHACSHAGLVDEGLSLFKFMLQDRSWIPKADQYTCMVDLLGRAGRLDEAYDLIKTMPFKPNHAVWGALLGACVIHVNVELGELAADALFELEPENTGNYVLLSKIYAASGRWKDAENVRRMMENIGLRKIPAHSVI